MSGDCPRTGEYMSMTAQRLVRTCVLLSGKTGRQTENDAGHASREVSESRVRDVSDEKLEHGLEQDVIPAGEGYPYAVAVHQFLD